MKLGRDVRRRARRGRAGRRGRARRLRRAGEHRRGSGSSRCATCDDDAALHVAACSCRRRSAARPTGSAAAAWSSVVGLGPAGPDWLTPEAQAELAAADALVGYAPYLARVPERRGQRRLRQRQPGRGRAGARRRSTLAAGGARVAVVSSGDPGIFAMAAAVLEALDDATARATSRCAWSRGCRRCRRPRRGSGRRSATTSACSRCRTSSSPGTSSSAAWTPRARPTWCSRSTTRPRGRGASSSSGPARCCCATARRRRRSWSRGRWAAARRRSR